MGKNSRKNKRRLLAQVGRGDSVPGGIIGAMFRNQNGKATPADIDFLIRMSREAKGKDGYTGASKPNGSVNPTTTQPYTPSYTFKVTHTQPAQDKEVFHCAEAGEVVGRCPLNPSVPEILIPITMWECFLACCKEYDTEWIALLMGKLDKDSEGKPAYVIDKFYFPPQTASGAHVDVPTGVKPKPGTIGAIHSHVDMGVFWSGTDTSHSNWPVEIVINRKEQYEALARYQLKCGEWAKSKAEVKITGSYVSKRIDDMVQAAFTQGEAMRKARLATIISPATTTAIVPAGIHPDDQAEVSEAIVSLGSYAASRCSACNHLTHYPGRACAALQCDCKDYVGPTPDPNPRKSCELHSECTKYYQHPGWCLRADNTYFRVEEGKVVEDDRWDKASATRGDAQSNLFHEPKDELTLPAEEYCQTCEGNTFVHAVIHGKDEWVACPDCRLPSGENDGLSALGRVRAAESLMN